MRTDAVTEIPRRFCDRGGRCVRSGRGCTQSARRRSAVHHRRSCQDRSDAQAAAAAAQGGLQLRGRVHAHALAPQPPGGGSVSGAFPSTTRSILAEICLCHACSCHEKLRMDTARRWRPQGCPQQPGAHRACPSGQLAVVVAGPWRPACGARGPLLPTPFSPNAFFTQRLWLAGWALRVSPPRCLASPAGCSVACVCRGCRGASSSLRSTEAVPEIPLRFCDRGAVPSVRQRLAVGWLRSPYTRPPHSLSHSLTPVVWLAGVARSTDKNAWQGRRRRHGAPCLGRPSGPAARGRERAGVPDLLAVLHRHLRKWWPRQLQRGVFVS
jgi:hypothetical protein